MKQHLFTLHHTHRQSFIVTLQFARGYFLTKTLFPDHFTVLQVIRRKLSIHQHIPRCCWKKITVISHERLHTFKVHACNHFSVETRTNSCCRELLHGKQQAERATLTAWCDGYARLGVIPANYRIVSSQYGGSAAEWQWRAFTDSLVRACMCVCTADH